ncbi:MAG TPA: YfaZ family outer membrane protein [Gammaproteobacteria bacterium]|nr:YfaZ family outer membrane protein [Gammaproteobacteria bacterium]
MQQGIDAYLGEDAIQVLYRRNMDIGELGRNDVRAGFFINEDRDLIGIADMLINVGRAEREHPAWDLQVGPRVYGALLSVENQDIFSIALGGTLSYHLGRQRSTWVSATAYYAPDITSFGNADSVTDISLEIETPLTEATRIFAGYRWFRFDLAPQGNIDSSDRKVDEGVHVGISYRF